jgi:hypothetical protein
MTPREAENLVFPNRCGTTTVAPSRKEGAPFRSSLARIPFTGEGSADRFSEACPNSGWKILGQTNVKLTTTAS